MLATEDPDLDYYNLAGTWQYEGRGMTIETFAQYFLYNITMTETYPNPFTTDNGERLYLVGAKQIKPDEGEFMKFVGTGLNRIVIGGGFLQDQIIMPVEVTIIVNEDGSGNATFIVGEEDPVTESWPAGSYAFQLIEFQGAYFLAHGRLQSCSPITCQPAFKTPARLMGGRGPSFPFFEGGEVPCWTYWNCRPLR